jgi:BMFP domain-containing protein YqiC
MAAGWSPAGWNRDQAELQQRVAELEARLAELEPAEAEDAGEEKAAA